MLQIPRKPVFLSNGKQYIEANYQNMKDIKLNHKLITRMLFVLSIGLVSAGAAAQTKDHLAIQFEEPSDIFTESEKQLAVELLTDSEREVRKLLPGLPEGIEVNVEIVDWDLDVVGGVTGRAETNDPPVVMIQVSKKFPGGVEAAINGGLQSVIYHEFHHLSLGWAVRDNQFTSDIQTATVIEGLAEVFSEEFTGVSHAENQMPQEVNAEDWIEEVRALPKDADYQTWMFQHPDGRTSIGYRTGNYLIKQALSNSGKTILELSRLSPGELWALAGYN